MGTRSGAVWRFAVRSAILATAWLLVSSAFVVTWPKMIGCYEESSGSLAWGPFI